MDVSVAEAKNRLPELIRLMESGERVVITRHGKPVAQIIAPPPERRVVRYGTMQGRIHIQPGALDPIDEEAFLRGDF
ncbi:MAG TPA: type II toxin-antitoxin system prevent-host-death family antitoxin [Bryobacteraceae bacterium]